MKPLVVIDGVVCSGKGAVSKAVAKQLGWLHLSSGEIYRAIGYFMCVLGGHWELNEEMVEQLLEEMDLKLRVEQGRVLYVLSGINVTAELSKEETAKSAALVAVFPVVRTYANKKQRMLTEQYSMVIDGRDLGTKVFPDAFVKVFLTADVEVRAHRRLEQLQEAGRTATYDEVLAALRERDDRDMHRSIDPLRQAEDALLIDTTDRTLDDEVEEIVALVSTRLGV